MHKREWPCIHWTLSPGLFPKKWWEALGTRLACVASVSNRVIARKLERKQKKGWRGRGRGEEETLAPKPHDSGERPLIFHGSPSPPPSLIFFCSCPSFLDEPREETLATQATLEAQEEADCTSMLSSIDSCQNSITWPCRGLRCRPIKVEYFWSYPLTIYSFSNDWRLTFPFF